MPFATRSLSPQESRVVLGLSERGRRETTRGEIVELLGAGPKAADHVIQSLRRKGWLERAAWGAYLLIPAEQGPDALGISNLLALASRIANRYYIGFGTAAAHYGLTTQHRNVIFLVTPERLRGRAVGESRVRIVNQAESKFFGFEPVDVLGYKVMISDREKTAIDCIGHPPLAGGVGEAATILANASRRFDWNKATDYLARINSGALARRFGWLADHVKARFLPTCASGCSGWPRGAARPGSAPLLNTRCRERSVMTRHGVSSLMFPAKSCTAARGSDNAKPSESVHRHANAASGSAVRHRIRTARPDQ